VITRQLTLLGSHAAQPATPELSTQIPEIRRENGQDAREFAALESVYCNSEFDRAEHMQHPHIGRRRA
jgi:hypothetical protein